MIDINFDYSKVKGSTELHNKFKKEFMIYVSKEFHGVAILPYDVAFVRAYSQPEVCYQMGQVGVPDTIIFGEGWYRFADMKTGQAKLSHGQVAFRSRMAVINGKTVVYKINSVKQGLDLIRVANEEA